MDHVQTSHQSSILMGQREYARHKGVTLHAVQTAIKTGRISVIRDAKNQIKIDPAVADAQWAHNTDPAKERKKTSDDNPHCGNPMTSSPQWGFATARAVKESYQARLTKLEYEERAGKLVSIDKVKMEIFRICRRTRDAMLNIPNRISDELAAEKSSHKVHHMLTVEINKALEELSHAL